MAEQIDNTKQLYKVGDEVKVIENKNHFLSSKHKVTVRGVKKVKDKGQIVNMEYTVLGKHRLYGNDICQFLDNSDIKGLWKNKD